jgi:hypothetical protein
MAQLMPRLAGLRLQVTAFVGGVNVLGGAVVCEEVSFGGQSDGVRHGTVACADQGR